MGDGTDAGRDRSGRAVQPANALSAKSAKSVVQFPSLPLNARRILRLLVANQSEVPVHQSLTGQTGASAINPNQPQSNQIKVFFCDAQSHKERSATRFCHPIVAGERLTIAGDGQ
jgi:hypothetical protein